MFSAKISSPGDLQVPLTFIAHFPHQLSWTIIRSLFVCAKYSTCPASAWWSAGQIYNPGAVLIRNSLFHNGFMLISFYCLTEFYLMWKWSCMKPDSSKVTPSISIWFHRFSSTRSSVSIPFIHCLPAWTLLFCVFSIHSTFPLINSLSLPEVLVYHLVVRKLVRGSAFYFLPILLCSFITSSSVSGYCNFTRWFVLLKIDISTTVIIRWIFPLVIFHR